MKTRDSRNNYNFLLGALTLLLLSVAVVRDHPSPAADLVRQLVFAGSLALGIWTLAERKWLLVGLALAGLAVAASTIALAIDSRVLRLGTVMIYLLFLILTICIATRDILFGGRVTMNRIVGALCIYLLIGVIFGLGAFLLQNFDHAAFRGIRTLPGAEKSSTSVADGEKSAEQGRREESHRDREAGEFIYFSFVTLTTLGYGDIVPVSGVARFLAYAAAILGQFYLTVLVATLVGMHIAHRQEGERTEEP